MPDGSLTTLEMVVDYYDPGGNANPGLESTCPLLSCSLASAAGEAARPDSRRRSRSEVIGLTPCWRGRYVGQNDVLNYAILW